MVRRRSTVRFRKGAHIVAVHAVFLRIVFEPPRGAVDRFMEQ
jgi:hypothetical protein